jgi:hypothetical protein
MRDKCRSCVYGGMVNVGQEGEMMWACQYILQEYERRPCRPGKECTVYQPRRRGRKKIWR